MKQLRPSRPWVLAGRVTVVLAIAIVGGLRALVHFTTYDGPTFGVSQVMAERDFVAWEGEHTAVRGRVVGAGFTIPTCNMQGIQVADVQAKAGGPHLTVLYTAQPDLLHAILQLPVISSLIPPGIPSRPTGIWTFKGHLSLDPGLTCGMSGSYALVADPMQ